MQETCLDSLKITLANKAQWSCKVLKVASGKLYKLKLNIAFFKFDICWSRLICYNYDLRVDSFENLSLKKVFGFESQILQRVTCSDEIATLVVTSHFIWGLFARLVLDEQDGFLDLVEDLGVFEVFKAYIEHIAKELLQHAVDKF